MNQPMSNNGSHYDVLVVGGGIAGMESALNLGDMGYKVLLVEKEASIGGKMVLLSKVFPTLDCASCISTPKMAATTNHPDVTTLTYTEIDEIVKRPNGGFVVKLRNKATFVDSALCTGCGECEAACTVAMPDQFHFQMVGRRAAHIAYPQAVPKKAVVERYGSSPCSYACPAGVRAHGFVSLVRCGKYEEAFDLHMDGAPLPGCLSRACYAPCETECTRNELEGPIPIRMIKRFMVDRYYENHAHPTYGPPETLRDEKVAVVGSGPGGLTAAYFLARRGYRVTVFEAASQAGGMLRMGIPSYRLPKGVLDRDIMNVTALGVELRVNTPVNSIKELEEMGFDAVFLAIGAMEAGGMGVAGEDLEGVVDCMTFLKRVNLDEGIDLNGKVVMVVGGGNAAIDPARVALRLGAQKVFIQYRRSRVEMPAHDWEVSAALAEGVEFQFQKAPTRFLGIDGRVVAAESISMQLGEPDSSGRRRPVPMEGSEETMAVDLVILSVGLRPGTHRFEQELALEKGGQVRVNPETLQTSVRSVFAGGDAATGPSSIVEAIGQARRAVFYIDRYLNGQPTEGIRFDDRLPVVDKQSVLERFRSVGTRPRMVDRDSIPQSPVRGFDELETGLTEEQARHCANRCLDCGGCCECQECVHACPADAISFDMRPEERVLSVDSVIVATGFELFDAHLKPAYGYGRYPDVITAMQMDRLLSPTRPYHNLVRPSDGKVPDSIAFVLCTGSRDYKVGNRLCSTVCCMYTTKQAQLLMGTLPLADITIYYIDIRAFGKGYEEFFEQAKGMGVNYVRGRVAKIDESGDGDLVLHYEDVAGSGVKHARHDLVVLSVGILPNPDALKLFKAESLEADPYAYVKEPDEYLDPGRASIDGVFVAGTASAARDIPDSILHSGAAAVQAAAYIEKMRNGV
jgi:heterodisulfide reductase subunit A-like polyferredoxin